MQIWGTNLNLEKICKAWAFIWHLNLQMIKLLKTLWNMCRLRPYFSPGNKYILHSRGSGMIESWQQRQCWCFLDRERSVSSDDWKQIAREVLIKCLSSCLIDEKSIGSVVSWPEAKNFIFRPSSQSSALMFSSSFCELIANVCKLLYLLFIKVFYSTYCVPKLSESESEMQMNVCLLEAKTKW